MSYVKQAAAFGKLAFACQQRRESLNANKTL
jgi:hypothetical protein